MQNPAEFTSTTCGQGDTTPPPFQLPSAVAIPWCSNAVCRDERCRGSMPTSLWCILIPQGQAVSFFEVNPQEKKKKGFSLNPSSQTKLSSSALSLNTFLYVKRHFLSVFRPELQSPGSISLFIHQQFQVGSLPTRLARSRAKRRGNFNSISTIGPCFKRSTPILAHLPQPREGG